MSGDLTLRITITKIETLQKNGLHVAGECGRRGRCRRQHFVAACDQVSCAGLMIRRGELVVAVPAIMDEKSVEFRSQQTGSLLVAAAGQDAVDRRVAGDCYPQPPGVPSYSPARFVHGDAGTRPDLADEVFVGRFALFSQARQRLAQPTGCQGQAKGLAENGGGFAQGNSEFFVECRRQRQGFRTHLRGGRSHGVGGLAGIATPDSFATFPAVADLDVKAGHPRLAYDLGLILVLYVPVLNCSAATGTTLWQGNWDFLIHLWGNRAVALTAVADSGLSTGASRIGLRLALGERRSLPLRRPSRDVEFVLQPVAFLPKFLFFLLDKLLLVLHEFLFTPKLFDLSPQLLIFVFKLFDSMTGSYAEQDHPAQHNLNQGICPAPAN